MDGSGYGRDQATDMVTDSLYLYICGTTYTGSANNYDYLIMQMRKSDGLVTWYRTYNGTSSNYDLATAILKNSTGIYVTGVSNNAGTVLDYHTIKYNTSGTKLWEQDFDYASLMDIPFDIGFNIDDTVLVVTGGSQGSLNDWDYQTVMYKYNGNFYDQSRVTGSGAGFDRAQAVATDDSGYVYITGATKNTDFDIKTVKLDIHGSLKWSNIYNSGGDDMGNDLIIDKEGYVYVSGVNKDNGQDFFVCKIRPDGAAEWDYHTDGVGGDDSARAICFDSWGNVIVTGQVYNPITYNYDFLTVGLSRDNGTEIWRDFFDGPNHGDDNATDITADTTGNIYVSGQIYTEEGPRTVTIKYRTDYFTSSTSS